MRSLLGALVLSAALSSAALGESDAEILFERESALAAAMGQLDLKALGSLLTGDVRVVRSDGIAFTRQDVLTRLDALFGLSLGATVSRSAETMQIARSGDYAFLTGTEMVSAVAGGSTSRRYLAIWRRIPEFEETWSLAFDAPLEVWKGLDTSLSVDAVSHSPWLSVVNLKPSLLAEQLEPASLRQSMAQDLACSVGAYYVPESLVAPDAPPKWGFYLAAWENDGSGWKLLHASFPEPTGTRPP